MSKKLSRILFSWFITLCFTATNIFSFQNLPMKSGGNEVSCVNDVNNPVTVVINVNQGYYEHASVTLSSFLLKSSPSTFFKFVVLHPDGDYAEGSFQRQELENLKRTFQCFNKRTGRYSEKCDIEFLNCGNAFDNFKLAEDQHCGGRDRFVVAAYYRLLLFLVEGDRDFLRSVYRVPDATINRLLTLDKVIYSDAGDVVALRDFSDLFNTDLRAGKFVGGVHDNFEWECVRKDEASLQAAREEGCDDVPKDSSGNIKPYVNSGILQLNLGDIRRIDVNCLPHPENGDTLLQRINNFGLNKRVNSGIKIHDQGLINVFLHDFIDLLDERWNTQCTWIDLHDFSMRVIPDPYAVHFCAPRKPLLYMSNVSYFAEYWYAVLHSPVAPSFFMNQARFGRNVCGYPNDYENEDHCCRTVLRLISEKRIKDVPNTFDKYGMPNESPNIASPSIARDFYNPSAFNAEGISVFVRVRDEDFDWYVRNKDAILSIRDSSIGITLVFDSSVTEAHKHQIKKITTNGMLPECSHVYFSNESIEKATKKSSIFTMVISRNEETKYSTRVFGGRFGNIDAWGLPAGIEGRLKWLADKVYNQTFEQCRDELFSRLARNEGIKDGFSRLRPNEKQIFLRNLFRQRVDEKACSLTDDGKPLESHLKDSVVDSFQVPGNLEMLKHGKNSELLSIFVEAKRENMSWLRKVLPEAEHLRSPNVGITIFKQGYFAPEDSAFLDTFRSKTHMYVVEQTSNDIFSKAAAFAALVKPEQPFEYCLSVDRNIRGKYGQAEDFELCWRNDDGHNFAVLSKNTSRRVGWFAEFLNNVDQQPVHSNQGLQSSLRRTVPLSPAFRQQIEEQPPASRPAAEMLPREIRDQQAGSNDNQQVQNSSKTGGTKPSPPSLTAPRKIPFEPVLPEQASNDSEIGKSRSLFRPGKLRYQSNSELFSEKHVSCEVRSGRFRDLDVLKISDGVSEVDIGRLVGFSSAGSEVFPFDISFYSNGNKSDLPEGTELRLTLPVSDNWPSGPSSILHLHDEVERVPFELITRNGITYVTFCTTSLSPFAFVFDKKSLVSTDSSSDKSDERFDSNKFEEKPSKKIDSRKTEDVGNNPRCGTVSLPVIFFLSISSLLMLFTKKIFALCVKRKNKS
jgi:lipopolysaccharide biosynthesis glycosyltransferase